MTTRTCVWAEDGDGVWNTECGEAFVFIDSGPKENSMRFCCYCGLALEEKAYAEPPEDCE